MYRIVRTGDDETAQSGKLLGSASLHFAKGITSWARPISRSLVIWTLVPADCVLFTVRYVVWIDNQVQVRSVTFFRYLFFDIFSFLVSFHYFLFFNISFSFLNYFLLCFFSQIFNWYFLFHSLLLCFSYFLLPSIRNNCRGHSINFILS
jgi:hypothetical protein